MQRLQPLSKARSGVAMQTTPSSSCRLNTLCRARATADASTAPMETEGTFRRAAHSSVHMLSPRDRMIPSGEQTLDGEPAWDGRESAGPDRGGNSSARPVQQGTDDSLYEVVMLPES